MGFALWLRQNSEHYLMLDAQRRIAGKYGRPAPPPPSGLRDRFWLQLFAPVYRLLPWRLRRLAIQRMPGSHRQAWSRAPERGLPAIGPYGMEPPPSPPTTQPETRGE
jgi:hypothetical protein